MLVISFPTNSWNYEINARGYSLSDILMVNLEVRKFHTHLCVKGKLMLWHLY